ncbi:hypothetical protein RYX36_028728, partial [Vicia faba]
MRQSIHKLAKYYCFPTSLKSCWGARVFLLHILVVVTDFKGIFDWNARGLSIS